MQPELLNDVQGIKINKKKLRKAILEFSTNSKYAFQKFDPSLFHEMEFNDEEKEILNSFDQNTLLSKISDDNTTITSALPVVVVVIITVNKDCTNI
jgi:hypothetical protein